MYMHVCVCKCVMQMCVCVCTHARVCNCASVLILKAQLPYKANTSGMLNEEKHISVT